MELPKVIQEPILFVECTPDNEYPLRILQSYRDNCNCKWKDSLSNPIYDVMNKHQDERAEILDKAIVLLKKHM